jgi:hypothetical protein
MTSDKELQSLQSADDLLECASCLQALGASVTVMGEKEGDSLYGEELTWLGFMIISQALSLKATLDENFSSITSALSPDGIWDEADYRLLLTRISNGFYPLDQARKEVMTTIKQIEKHIRRTKDLLSNFQKLRQKYVSLNDEASESNTDAPLRAAQG